MFQEFLLTNDIVKANMASDLPADQKMTDTEVLAQITTFVSSHMMQVMGPADNVQMLAGNETSSTALTWILWMMAKHPESQERLRKEVQDVGDERPSM